MFPPGAYVALLQPYLKHPRDDPAMPPMLRCDHPNGVRIFGGRDEWMRAMRECSGSAEPRDSVQSVTRFSMSSASSLLRVEDNKACYVSSAWHCLCESLPRMHSSNRWSGSGDGSAVY